MKEIESRELSQVSMTVTVRYHSAGGVPLSVERTVRFSLVGFLRLTPMQHGEGNRLVTADAVAGFCAAMGVTAEDMNKLTAAEKVR